MDELADDEKDKDTGERKERHWAPEEEFVVDIEVSDVHADIEEAKVNEGAVLLELIELQDFFEYVELWEQG